QGRPHVDLAHGADLDLRRQHPDHEMRLSVEPQGASHDRWIRAEMARPEAMAEHHDAGSARTVVPGLDQPAPRGPPLADGEEAGGGRAALDAEGLADAAQVVAPAAEGREVHEARVVAPPVEEIGVGGAHALASPLLVGGEDEGEAGAVAERKGAD